MVLLLMVPCRNVDQSVEVVDSWDDLGRPQMGTQFRIPLGILDLQVLPKRIRLDLEKGSTSSVR